MHVKKITVTNFFNLDNVTIEFPDTGITLITGVNGSGKSALGVESVAVAFGGKTLRKTPPWRIDLGGSLDVTTEELQITRGKEPKSSPTLEWAINGQQPQSYGTPTKGQEALEKVIGDWDTWRRVSVLSPMSQDLALFTSATDAARKRLIESLVGLELFDAAAKVCRKDKRTAADACTQKLNKISALTGELTGAREWLASEKDVPTETVIDIDETEISKLEGKRGSLRKAVAECDKAIEAAQKNIGDILMHKSASQVELKQATSRSKLIDYDQCPTCSQPIPETLKDEISDSIETARQLADKAEKVCANQLVIAKEELVILKEDRDDLLDSERAAASAISNIKSDSVRIKELKKKNRERAERLATAQAKINTIITTLETCEAELVCLQEELALLSAAEQVLDLEGVRSKIVGKMLGGIEATVNRWLLEIVGPELQVELRDYTETGSSGITGKISLKVHGAGGGYGYDASSPGERRRIDIAFLFALKEVASAARGAKPGDIYADEITDGVDVAGRMAVAETLRRIASDTHIVVITHDVEFAQMLQPTQHFHLLKSKGNVTITRT